MVVPIDSHEDKAEDIAEEGWQDRLESGPVHHFRDFEFQHHDGDDDGDHAVAEGLDP